MNYDIRWMYRDFFRTGKIYDLNFYGHKICWTWIADYWMGDCGSLGTKIDVKDLYVHWLKKDWCMLTTYVEALSGWIERYRV